MELVQQHTTENDKCMEGLTSKHTFPWLQGIPIDSFIHLFADHINQLIEYLFYIYIVFCWCLKELKSYKEYGILWLDSNRDMRLVFERQNKIA